MPLVSSVTGIIGGIQARNAAKDAGAAINDAAQKSAGLVGDATKSGQAGVQGALDANATNINNAGDKAIGTVNDATNAANNTLGNSLSGAQGNFDAVKNNLNPYLSTGQTAASGLDDYIKSKPQFSFNYDDYKNSDAYNFQLAQGQKAIGNSAAASGLANSGAALKELTNYGQGLASTYYNDAFSRAKSTFDTNQNATLSNLTAGINTGLGASGQLNSATQNMNSNILGVGGQQAQNTLGAGYYGGQTTTGLAQYLASQGMQGNEFNAGFGLEGSNLQGQDLLKGAQGIASGDIGAANGWNQALGAAGGLFGGGGLNTLANVFKSKPSGYVVGDQMGG